MADPPVTSKEFLDKYSKDTIRATWTATGIFTGIAYGSGVLIRPFAPATAGKVASLGSSTHLPPPTQFKGAAFPRAGALTLFNALPAPGWIVPPEVFGLKPGYLIEPGEFGPDATKLLHLAGLEPTQERADQFRAMQADKISLEHFRFVPLLDTPTLIAWHQKINTPDFQRDNPNTRASELSSIVYAQLLKRQVFSEQPADDFERVLLSHAAPKKTPAEPHAPKQQPANPLPLPPAVPAPTVAPTTKGIFGVIATSARNAPETFQPVNDNAISNVAAATGIRKQLVSERFDP